jgi:HK97 gp10 family phage protein
MSEIVKIEGMEQTVRNMRKFQRQMNKNVVSFALRKGANVIRDQAKQNAPYDPTPDGVHIRDDIKVRRDPRPERQGMNEIMYIRPYGKKGNRKRGPARKKSTRQYWFVQEFKRGKRFMTRAWESKKHEAHEVILNTLKKEVDKQVARIKA